MIETLKDKLEEDCKRWAQQAKTSYYKSTKIDFSVVWNELFTRNILHIAFGEDISKEKINFKVVDAKQTDTSIPMPEKEVTFGDAIALIFKQLTPTIKMKAANVLYRLIYKLTGKSMEFTRYEREVEENCLRLRSFIRDYIRARQSGKRASTSNEVDLLSLFFSSPEVFTEDFIIDELVDFFIAASATTQNATQTILGHFATSPDSVERARKEFEIVSK